MTTARHLPAAPLHPGEPPWEHGDLVLDSNGEVWTRASPGDEAQGWPWRQGADVVFDFKTNRPMCGEGGHSKDAPIRPLTLLAPRGQPAQTIVMSSDAP